MVKYPQDLPTDAVQTLVKMITSKSFDKQDFALAMWNVQGYAQSKLLGEEAPLRVFGESPEPSDEDALDALQSLETPNVPNAVGGPLSGIALKVILKWALKKALEIL